MTTVATVFDPRANSLNTLRLVFALSVIVSHSWALGGFGDEPGAGGATLGTWAVLGFFGISGYLITRSRLSGQRATHYYRSRMLRIFPALLVCLAVVAFVLAPLSAVIDGSSGWNLPDALTYVLRNAALYPPVLAQDTVGGTLADVPYSGIWDQPLWTLFWEGFCYLGIGIAASILPRRALPPTAFVMLVALLAAVLANQAGVVSFPELITRVSSLAIAFIAGMLLYFFADRIPVNRYVILASLVVLAAAIATGSVQSIGSLAFVYLVMTVGSSLPIRPIPAKNDISYGVYIYGWPVQQFVFVVFGNDVALPVVILGGMAGAVVLAYLSCRFIEQPAMKLKAAPQGDGNRSRVQA